MQLLFQRYLEQQNVISTLYQRLENIDHQQQSQQRELYGLTTAISAATIALKTSETKQEKQLKDEIKNFDNKVSKELRTLNTEVTTLKRQTQALMTTHK
jgi:uncharacterized protein YlxW (UPF0749 family)